MAQTCQICETPIEKFTLPVCTSCAKRFAIKMEYSSQLSRDPLTIKRRNEEHAAWKAQRKAERAEAKAEKNAGTKAETPLAEPEAINTPETTPQE